MRKRLKKTWLVVSILLLSGLVVHLVRAAFSGTQRRLSDEAVLSDATVSGGVSLGDSTAEGYMKLTPTDSPPTCDASSEGMVYVNSSDHVLYLCDGSNWGSI